MTLATRTFYRKRYCVCPQCDDSLMKVVELRGQFGLHGVKNPVVHDAYIKRSFHKGERLQDVYMLWRFNYRPSRYIIGTDRLKDWSIDGDFEKFFTFDIIAASNIPIEDESAEDAIRLAHDQYFLRDYVRPALLTAHCEPSPIIRREWIEVPRVVVSAVPMIHWDGGALSI